MNKSNRSGQIVHRNINSIRIKKKNRARTKIIAILIIIISVMSMFSINASAASVSTNSWGLITSQVDRSYFFIGGTTLNSGWSTSAQNAWCLSYSVSADMNRYIVSTSSTENLVEQMEYLYDNSYSAQAVAYGNRWNTIWYEVTNLVTDTEQICSNGSVTETQNLYNQLQTEQDKLITLAGEINSSYAAVLASSNYPNIISELSTDSIGILNIIWQNLGNILKTIGTNSVNTDSLLGISWTSSDIQNTANTVSSIVKTFAYALACILFGINVTVTALQYEIMTLRGGVKVFARVLLVKIWIDLAIPICIAALNMINSLASQIFELFTVSNVNFFSTFGIVDYQPATTGNSVVDTILQGITTLMNFFTSIIYSGPILIILIILIVVVLSVFIKIISRAFELTALIAISPIFFATLVGDETKRYFRRFISAFLSTAGYIVFMAIVYAVASQWIEQCSTVNLSSLSDLAAAIVGMLPRVLIIIACCRIMKKPPKVLTSLFDGG